MLGDALIDPFIATANQNHSPVLARESLSLDLSKDPPLGGEKHDCGSSVFDIRMVVTKQCFNCAKDRLRLQHHPVAAAERPIVDNVMFIVCERTKIVNHDLDYSLPPRALDDSVVEWTGEKLRKNRQDVKTHSGCRWSVVSGRWSVQYRER
jgi:hypothetical protein